MKPTILLTAVLTALTACGDSISVDGEPVKLGVLAPKTGGISDIGEMMEDIAGLAAEQINARGGVDGRPLEILVVDTGTTDDVGDLFRQLVADGAVGIIGPAIQEQVASVVPAAVDTRTPFVSPVSTTVWGDERPNDDGYMFRNVPTGEFEGLAMAYYLRELSGYAPKDVPVVLERQDSAVGLVNTFRCIFTRPVGGIARRSDTVLLFNRAEPSDGDNLNSDGKDFEALIVADQVDSLSPIPQALVLVALPDDAKAILDAWVYFGATREVRWMLTSTAKTPEFLQGLPGEVLDDGGDTGAAPTPPLIGRAYRTFERAYADSFGGDVGNVAFAPNVWDAAYLLAAAATKQAVEGGTIGGQGLRDAVGLVSRDGPILHAGQWQDLTAILSSGGDIDFDGASGPVDFDPAVGNEVIGPYEVWQLVPGDGAPRYERVVYIDQRNINELFETLTETAPGPEDSIFDLFADCPKYDLAELEENPDPA